MLLKRPTPTKPFIAQDYHCRQCQRSVSFPEILYDDGLCGLRHKEV